MIHKKTKINIALFSFFFFELYPGEIVYPILGMVRALMS